MKTLKQILLAASLAAPSFPSAAQVEEAWVARYNGGFSNRTHVPVAMLLDSAGNACVAGSSQNAVGVYDYVVLRYAPTGAQLPTVRYSSTNDLNWTVNDLALDQAGNAYVTGTGGTAKLGTNGAVVWAAPYAGNGLATDADADIYVTGFSTNYYATAKLDPSGSNLWVRTYVSPYTSGLWSNVSQKVAVDASGGVFVAGWETYGPPFWCDSQRLSLCRYAEPSMLKYDSSGTCLWTNAYAGCLSWGRTKALIPDGQGGAYVAASNNQYLEYLVTRLSASGQTTWSSDPSSLNLVSAAVGDAFVYATGVAWCTIKLAATNGQVIWTPSERSPGQASAIAVDPAGRLCVAGVQFGPTNGTDSALIRYDPANGNQLWVKRYDGPAHGDDGAVAMAVASDGSIYVTGFSANTNGGTDIFVIKYVPSATIQRRSDGSMRLQFSGQPGQTCGLEASTNFASWATLGLAEADTNGLFQFDDTNAPNFPQRMYRWHYP